MTANTNLIPVFQAKFGWDDQEKVYYSTLISTIAVIGLSLGTLVGGKTMTIGRRRALIIMEVVAFVGGLITQVLDVRLICIGRFMYGLTAGHATIIMAKSVDETFPGELASRFGVITNAFNTIGIMLVFFLSGAVVPKDASNYSTNETWRIIYALPCVIALAQIILFLFVFKQEPIRFCVANDREAEAKAFMRKVYKKEQDMSDEVFEQLIGEQYVHETLTTSTEVSKVGFREAVCGPKYRRAAWTLFILNTFNQ